MIVAFAGRRIDDPRDTIKRFPTENVWRVKNELTKYFSEHNVRFLISSAACGSDLLAVDVALGLGITIKIILPFEAAHFKRSSVIDRPGNWANIFDRVISNSSQSEVINLQLSYTDDKAYEKVNRRILDEAQMLSRSLSLPLKVLVAWDGEKKAAEDTTYLFISEARQQMLEIASINTN